MRIQGLGEGWVVRAGSSQAQVPDSIAGRDIPAIVPGCVHTDLLGAGLIADPYLDRNEALVQWIGETDWLYRCRLGVDAALLAHERVELVCEGLDTLAHVELNGQLIGESMDMHVPCAFDAAAAIKPGDNELVVRFDSALNYVRRREREIGAWPHVMPPPFNHIRKMACNFGWDWGPTLITAGIWQPISLRAWNTARIAAVRPLVVEASEHRATLHLHVDIDRTAAGAAQKLRLQCVLAGHEGGQKREATVPPHQKSACLEFVIDDPQLWWPVGHGDQPLYGLSVLLKGPDGQLLDERLTRTGLRQVRLDTSPDAIGSRFVVQVNGRDILVKGADWIPDDCFPTRISRHRLAGRIEQAVGANMNMLRVWGGGIFESEDFYDLCDERGVLVWQDFLFACAAYPEGELDRLVEAEARHHVARLSRHPSLVLWCGNNENLWGWFDWGWKGPLAGRSWGAKYYFELLPRVVAELDPSRPYWPGSPYSGSMDRHPLDPNHGNNHVWDVWGGKHYRHYRDHRPRFVSEFGFQAPPTLATISRAIPPDQWSPDSAAMLAHQKGGGNPLIHKYLAEQFAGPADFADWVYLAQLNQARAIRTGVEWWRSLGGRCMGTLYWQINDCWPVTSWAAVDGDGRPKLLWYATRRFYAPRLLTIQPDGDGLRLCACNDSPGPWSGRGSVVRMDFAGKVLASQDVTLDVPAWSSQDVAIDAAIARAGEPARQMVVARVDDAPAATWFFAPDKDLEYPAPQLTGSLREVSPSAAPAATPMADAPGSAMQGHCSQRKYLLTLTAGALVRDIAIFADLLDPEAAVSDQLLTLLPGQSVQVQIISRSGLEAEALMSPPVLQCANRFGGRRRS